MLASLHYPVNTSRDPIDGRRRVQIVPGGLLVSSRLIALSPACDLSVIEDAVAIIASSNLFQFDATVEQPVRDKNRVLTSVPRVVTDVGRR